MKISQDYYLVVDLEATCTEDKSIRRDKMETIEIGAVMLNAKTGERESEYQTFVKPILNPILTDFCKTLTSISQQDVDRAPLFPEAIAKFKQWLEPFESYLFCSWGGFDRSQIQKDCNLHAIEYPFYQGHLNLKKAFSVAINSKRRFGMVGALKELNLTLEGTHHRGIDDARNIANIVKAVSIKNFSQIDD